MASVAKMAVEVDVTPRFDETQLHLLEEAGEALIQAGECFAAAAVKLRQLSTLMNRQHDHQGPEGD